jgi:hypothetical protein
MHTITLTVLPGFTVLAFVSMHPLPVTVHLKPVLPHLPKAVAIDVALVIFTPDAQTAGYTSISKNRCRHQTSVTSESIITYQSLIF